MSASPGGNQVPPAGAQPGAQQAGPPRAAFGDPTQRPNEPISNGAPFGPGAGPEALGIPNMQNQDLAQLVPYLPAFQAMANQPGSSRAARNLVRQIMAFAAGSGGQ